MLKIKTVGDAMMACAGLLEPEAAPVARCVDLGLAILEAVRHHPAGWTLRVGVHFGPVVSGLVGQRQFLYDIWGDTVNTAQRVEQHGVVGKVCVSPTARAKLSARFRTTSIGTVDIKGKGPMELFVAEVAGSSRRLAAVVPDAPSPAARAHRDPAGGAVGGDVHGDRAGRGARRAAERALLRSNGAGAGGRGVAVDADTRAPGRA